MHSHIFAQINFITKSNCKTLINIILVLSYDSSTMCMYVFLMILVTYPVTAVSHRILQRDGRRVCTLQINLKQTLSSMM